MNGRLTIDDCRLKTSVRGPWSVVRGSGAVVASLAVIVCIGCAGKPKLDTTRVLPATGDAQGWTKSSETRVFPADHLYEYIDGDADKYIHAGVEQALTSDYNFEGKSDAVADVFILANAGGARAVFESFPAAGGESVAVGDAARLYQGSFILCKGRFFVRLVAFQQTPDTQQALLVLGRAIVAKLEKR